MARIPIVRLPDGESPTMMHGGDYNPDQWIHRPDILSEDVRLMQLARLNCASIGIFAWVALEPAEGTFTFDWLDAAIERLHAAGVKIFLAGLSREDSDH